MSSLAYQHAILPHVSRTFALTIPQLPTPLSDVVTNAYLLCRIADTIEDDNKLRIEQKEKYLDLFSQVVEGKYDSKQFAQELTPLLSPKTPEHEIDLVKNTPLVVQYTHELNISQKQALERCVKIMSEGMHRFEHQANLSGLETLEDFEQYCYFVAGVVGEMLTELFCDYSEKINEHKQQLLKLSISFGQGLQMTNIIKDQWEDRLNGVCWLPQDIFKNLNFDLSQLPDNHKNAEFKMGLEKLIYIALQHLTNALDYVCLIPKEEVGIRKFCLWAIGLAVLTLRKINNNLEFTDGQAVKVTRRTVKLTVLTTELTHKYNSVLKKLFKLASPKIASCDNG